MFDNPEALKSAMMSDIFRVMRDLGEDVKEIVQDSVLDWVYNNPGNKTDREYIREYDMNPEKSFWGSWVSDFDFSKIDSNIISFLTRSDPTLMSFGMEDYAGLGQPYTAIHGGNVDGTEWYGEDRRAKLAQYISTGYRWDWGNNAMIRREFMPKAIEKLDRDLDGLVRVRFAMQGIRVFKGDKRRRK